MKEITKKIDCNDRVLERALELAEDIYWGEDHPGDKEWLDTLIDFLDAERVPDPEWDFLCLVNGGETAESLDEKRLGDGRRVYSELRDII